MTLETTLLCLFPLLLGQQPGPTSKPVEPELPALPKAQDALDAAIGAPELYAHVATLASDEMNGRFTGSEGGLAAADYLVRTLAKLEAHGLEPAGDDGGYLQDVHLPGVGFSSLPSLAVSPGETLVFGRDFDLRSGFDFEGELELVRVVDPAAAPAEPRANAALYMDMLASKARAVRLERGAAWAAGWGAILERGSRIAGRGQTTPAEVTRVRGPERPLILQVRGEGREALAEQAGAQRLRLAIGGKQKQAYNVLARLRATTPLARGATRETVVISAHYDHLRPRSVPEGQDGIYNGADDDASGVAAVLEIVEALALTPSPRARDLVVLLATGEEIGLIGTTYYLDHPVAPLASTSANLNFEMLGRPDELVGGAGALWLTGFGYTNLGPSLVERGLRVHADPRPNQHFFERSDNYAFVLKGVIGQSLSSYNLHEDYHHVSDEADTLDYSHLQQGTAIGLAATELLLGADFDVAWSPDYSLPRR